MSQKSKAVKGKVLFGYLLLFSIAAVSVWFVYTQILVLSKPDISDARDNQQIIGIGNVVTTLYASEAIGRNAILTGSKKDLGDYKEILDSVKVQIDSIKLRTDIDQLGKLDTIQTLLVRKEKSIAEIIRLRNVYNSENAFDRAVGQINVVKDSLVRNVKPVEFQSNSELRTFLTNVLTDQQLDSLSRLPVPNDELTLAIEKMLTDIIVKDNRMKYDLFQKEQRLQDESRVISDQLRIVLSSLEKNIIEKSFARLEASEKAIDETTSIIAWVGMITFGLLLLFAWIIGRDLTNNQKYRQQLELLNTEKEDLLRSKTMLLATVTHDIQTPLGSVLGFADLLKETDLNFKQKQYLENIGHSSHYIQKLVNDLIDFSKLEKNRISIEKVSFNFSDLIVNTCKSLEPKAIEKKIAFHWRIDRQLNANFISDPYRIKQILTNLISNAVKFTPEGSVTVTATVNGDSVSIAVVDTGIGIAEDQQTVVFREFTQAHTGIEKKFGGTGLGLTIANRMLDLLGGSIAVRSTENKGSVFTIELPLERSDIQESEPVVDADTSYEFLRGKRILIVDDDITQLTLMREVFAAYPAEIQLESDASTVIKNIETLKPDLILSDIQMPIIDGFELIRQLRSSALPEIAEIPVIAMSGKRNLLESDFTSKGFTASHPKPLQLDVLLDLIRGILSDGPVVGTNSEELEPSQTLFNLQSLRGFTQADPGSLRLIIETFIDSTYENCEKLIAAANENDADKMSEIAHKMIPMLRQMEVHSIVNLLEPVEERALETSSKTTIAEEICGKLYKLINELKSEIA